MDKETDNLIDLYTLAELSYIKMFKEYNQTVEDIFPRGWYKIKGYKEKIEILGEALNKKCLIIDTLSYSAIKETVRTN